MPERSNRHRRRRKARGGLRGRASFLPALLLFLGSLSAPAGAAATGPRVLRVGTWHGIPGPYHTIQAAVDNARPGDWVLVGPGLYHERGAPNAGVLITTPGVHLRGMDRNRVIVDGTRPSAARPCAPQPSLQDFGPRGPGGEPEGRNGVEVYRTSGVTVENLTACNFLSSPDGENGNEIWFNGGDGSGRLGLGRFAGRFLSATTTYYRNGTSPRAMYGIFADNTFGPGVFADTYAANMADSAYYIGACPDCNVVIVRGHAVNSALGYSGTNSGGHLIIQGSEFDRNRAGIVPNSLNNDDAPSPQDGACPDGQQGPYGNGSCTIIRANFVHDNNNPNAPGSGLAGAVPVGAGIEISGGQNDTIVGNRVENQGSWGIVVHDFPDTEEPPEVADCSGGVKVGSGVCFFQAFGNAVAHNVFRHNGFFGNPGNADLANESSSVVPGNCFFGNADRGGELTSDPPEIEHVDGRCGGPAPGDGTLAGQLLCASGIVGAVIGGASCPVTPASHYPKSTGVRLVALPAQRTMPNPCAGVPGNPWCPSRGGPSGHASDRSAASRRGTAPRAGAGPAGKQADGLFLNVLPAGQGTTTTPADALRFFATGQPPPHSDDQLGMYAKLPRAQPVGDADLTRYFKVAALGVAAKDVERVERPRPGLTILRDRFGVPHIYGKTRAAAMWGAGYVTGQDRLFMADALRHVGRGRTSEFLGPTPANLAMDSAWYMVAGYSERELLQQVARLRRFGPAGRQAITDGRDFIAGINARIDQDLDRPDQIPAEYPALQIMPQHWQPSDIVAVATLIQAVFAAGGGGELANADLLQRVERRYGPRRGRALFQDLRESEDPAAPVTADAPFDYGVPGPVNPAAVALPDAGSVVAYHPLTTGSDPAPLPGRGPGANLDPIVTLRQGLAAIGLRFPTSMSNWLAVTADHTAAGHPIAVMGPQVGYFSPEILMEMDIHGPGIESRGATFPGISLYVLLGRGPDFAWSATSGESDLTDVRAERLCDPNGGSPSIHSTAYVFDGRCVRMTVRTDRWVAKPTAGGPGQPAMVKARVERTIHGPVIAHGEVHGQPVAYVTQRSTFFGELDSAVAFTYVNGWRRTVTDAISFQQAISNVTGSFNWLYVDDRSVGYYHSGRYPLRADGVDPDLPSWGTGRWEWRGFVPFDRHPQAVDPAKGWIDSWNNKPAHAWRASDASYNFGPVHRVDMLTTRLGPLVAGGDVTPSGMVNVMADAATVDLRGQEDLPVVLRAIGTDRQLAPYLRILRSWAAKGAHRVDRDGDQRYDASAAVALMDAWWPRLAQAIFDPTLRGLYRSIPMGFDDANRTNGLGSSFQSGYFGYVQKAVQMALGERVAQPYRVLRCADGTGAGCRRALLASLRATIDQLGPDPSRWNASESGDLIRFTAVGLVSLEPIEWQNRPTFQQVVQVFRNRSR